MLNMLIAIMGDTFERVIENRQINSTKTKLTLLRDLSAVLPEDTSGTNEECDFLSVVKPDDD